MALMSYKCPNCGGGLQFDPPSGKFKCEFCLSEFTEEEMKRLEEEEARKKALYEEESGEQSGKSGSFGGQSGERGGSGGQSGESGSSGGQSGEPGGSGGQSGESGSSRGQSRGPEGSGEQSGKPGSSGIPERAVIYSCPSCGAEIVTDATTAATFCYYCHNPVVLSGRLSGELMPDYVLPFSIDKKGATEKFLSWIGKKKFVPKSFYSKDQIEKLSGIYFPYLLYSCQVDGKLNADAEKNRTWTTGNIQFTEHKKYQVERAGCLEVKNLTRNALLKANRELVEGVLPFETEKMLPFQMGYLSGFQAQKRDIDGQSFTADAELEVKNYTVEQLKSSINGYANVNVKNSETHIRDARWQYALLPVWTLTYKDRQKGKVYYFVMNGQTGKIWGKLPVDKGKLAVLFLEVFLPVFAVLMIGGWFL